MKRDGLILCFVTLFLISGQSEGAEPSAPEKAVFETSKENGFKVGKKGLENIEVKLAQVTTSETHTLPVDSLVRFQNHVGVYRLRDGWFKLIPIQITKKGATTVTARCSELAPGDALVVEGAALMRVTEMDAFGGEG